MACGAAEVGAHKCLDEFQSQCGSNDLSTQTDDIHVIAFHALTGGKDIMDVIPYSNVRNDSAICLFKTNPPWSEAIPTRNERSNEYRRW
jgi:hypothetical protein